MRACAYYLYVRVCIVLRVRNTLLYEGDSDLGFAFPSFFSSLSTTHAAMSRTHLAVSRLALRGLQPSPPTEQPSKFLQEHVEEEQLCVKLIISHRKHPIP